MRKTKYIVVMLVVAIATTTVTAGIIAFVMQSNQTFNIQGKDKWVKINNQSIPYSQVLNMDIDAGDSGVIEYNISNSWVHDITIYCNLSGFSGLTVDLDTTGALVIPAGSWVNNDLSYSADPWLLSENITGVVYFNTTG